MAETDNSEQDAGGSKKGGMMPTIIAAVVVTLIAAGAGAGLGSVLGSSAPPPAEPAKPAEPDPHAAADAKAPEKSDIAASRLGEPQGVPNGPGFADDDVVRDPLKCLDQVKECLDVVPALPNCELGGEGSLSAVAVVDVEIDHGDAL